MYEQTTNLLGFPTLRSLGSALSCRRNAVSAIRLRRQSLRLGLATPLPSQGDEMYEETTNLLGFPTLRSLGSALSCQPNTVSAIRLRRRSLRLGLATPLPS